MANRDTRRATKRKRARQAAKRTGDSIPQDWDFTEYDAEERAQHARAEAALERARKHAHGCGDLAAGFSGCLTGCETDAQFRARLVERFG